MRRLLEQDPFLSLTVRAEIATSFVERILLPRVANVQSVRALKPGKRGSRRSKHGTNR
jgi:hypothetical protein